jgi:hypothetical protein
VDNGVGAARMKVLQRVPLLNAVLPQGPRSVLSLLQKIFLRVGKTVFVDVDAVPASSSRS